MRARHRPDGSQYEKDEVDRAAIGGLVIDPRAKAGERGDGTLSPATCVWGTERPPETEVGTVFSCFRTVSIAISGSILSTLCARPRGKSPRDHSASPRLPSFTVSASRGMLPPSVTSCCPSRESRNRKNSAAGPPSG